MAFDYLDLPTHPKASEFLLSDGRASLLATNPTAAIWKFLELQAPPQVFTFAFEKEKARIDLNNRNPLTGDTFLHFAVRLNKP